MRLLAALALTLVLTACSSTPKTSSMSSSAPDRIVYDFRDSSVPPPYHRSYTIEVSSETAKVNVRDYDKVLAEKEVEMTEEKWKALVEMAGELKGKGGKYFSSASGTRGYSLKLMQGEEETYLVSWDSMKTDKVKEKVLALCEAVKNCIPDLTELIQSTREF